MYVCGIGGGVRVCVCDGDIERQSKRKAECAFRKIPSGVSSACRDEAWIFYLTRASSKEDTKKKKKKSLQLLNESVCLKVLHFTWLHPSHVLYMGFVASVQLCNHVLGIEALKEHSNQHGGHFSPNPQYRSSVPPRSFTKGFAYTDAYSPTYQPVRLTNLCGVDFGNFPVSRRCTG